MQPTPATANFTALRLIHYLWLLATLFIPLYYASEATQVLSAYFGRGSRVDDAHLLNTRDVELGATTTSHPIPAPNNVHIDASALPRTWSNIPPSSMSPERTRKLAVNASLAQLKSRWATYVEHRRNEWIMLISAVGAILLSHEFALIWKRSARLTNLSFSHMSWAILAFALPAIAFGWGIVFIILAIFLSLWRNGLVPDPSPSKGPELFVAAFARIFVTVMSLYDLAWLAWLIKTLNAFNASLAAKS
ncbi:hypothetical protein DXG01_003720 [Tephrocybe rancida]|nr:hypothetical protein DXG01_003720 [Tephrocybe rancida]